MLTTFVLDQGCLRQCILEEGEPLPPNAVWVDLSEPTPEERLAVEGTYGFGLPSEDDVEEIEATARFFIAEDGVHIHSLSVHDLEDRPEVVSVAYIVKEDRLFTIHDEDLATFRLFRLRARRQCGQFSDGLSVLIALFETKVDHMADVLEEIYGTLEQLSRTVLREVEREELDLEDVLEDLAEEEDLTGKVRLALMDTQRALSFLRRRPDPDESEVRRIDDMARDVESLLPHTAFLFDKVNFLMGAVQGFINIQQNQIIKIFSIAAVVFLPPTLIASIYGMNFRLMPELHWPWGYPLAVVLMIISGITPYLLFKRKGWL